MGYSTHSIARQAKRLRLQLLQTFMPSVAGAFNGAMAETLEILMDGEQANQLLTSLHESRTGAIVSFDAAFGDL